MQANAINQALFEDKQGQLEAEVERLRCVSVRRWAGRRVYGTVAGPSSGGGMHSHARAPGCQLACHLPLHPAPAPAPPRSQLIEGPWPRGAPAELQFHRMTIINLGANIDTRIQKMYEVCCASCAALCCAHAALCWAGAAVPSLGVVSRPRPAARLSR